MCEGSKVTKDEVGVEGSSVASKAPVSSTSTPYKEESYMSKLFFGALTWGTIYFLIKRYDDLTWLEAYWNIMLEKFTEFQISTFITFVLHESMYFMWFVPWYIIDQIPYFKKFKIQPNKTNDGPQMWKCFKTLMFNHIFIQMPMMLMTHSFLKFFDFTMEAPLPSLSSIAWKVGFFIFCTLFYIHISSSVLRCTQFTASNLPTQSSNIIHVQTKRLELNNLKINFYNLICDLVYQIPLFFIVEDFYFYWIHRALHHKSIYKYIHKVHHTHSAPFGIAAEYAHPAETLLLGFGTMLGPILFARHLLTLWIWLGVRLMETVEDHSGYELPFSPTNFIPFWGGAVHHDYHHKEFEGNYASVFTIWDWVFGTDEGFRASQLEKKDVQTTQWSDLIEKMGMHKSAAEKGVAGSKRSRVAPKPKSQ